MIGGALLRRITFWLCIILSCTTLLVVLGRSSNATFPSITSSKPSGTRLAAEVLELNGFKVRQDLNSAPQVANDEVIIAFVRRQGRDPMAKFLLSKVSEGRRMIVIMVSDDFNAATTSAETPIQIQNSFQDRILRVNGTVALEPDFWSGSEPLDVWVDASTKQALVSFQAQGNGVIATVHDGLGFTNRFIDRADNAAFFATLVRSVAGENKRVVFTEATFGNVFDEGMISALGGWARATVWQGYLLFGVVAWSSAVIFGIPLPLRRRQAGTRDLMEAFAQMLQRAKNLKMAQSQVVESLRRDLLRMASLPANATDAMLESRLPQEVKDDLIAAQGLPSDSRTLAAITRLRVAISSHVSKIDS